MRLSLRLVRANLEIPGGYIWIPGIGIGIGKRLRLTASLLAGGVPGKTGTPGPGASQEVRKNHALKALMQSHNGNFPFK